jgi:hypothetical protein
MITEIVVPFSGDPEMSSLPPAILARSFMPKIPNE